MPRRGRAQHRAGGKTILDQHEAKGRDRVQDVIEPVEVDDDVDILVISGLHAQPWVRHANRRPTDGHPARCRASSIGQTSPPGREDARALTTRLTATRHRETHSRACA